MKYKLINKQTEEETLCDKVTIDGFDYYVSEFSNDSGGWHIDMEFLTLENPSRFNVVGQMKKVIATTNPNIDIPKVVDEVEKLAHEYFAEERDNWEQENPNGIKSPQSLIEHYNRTFTPIFRVGYNKSQETHPNSDEDMIEFGQWVSRNDWVYLPSRERWVNEDREGLEQKLSSQVLLQIWKEQRIKTLYYE